MSLLRGSNTSSPPRFIEEKSSFEYGQVNQALAAAMRTLVKEHLILVSQLEQLQRQGLLSLPKLWFYVQPALRTVDILASLGGSVGGPQGGTCSDAATPGGRVRWILSLCCVRPKWCCFVCY